MAVFPVMERGEDGEKIKGRPMAADEKTGEADILFSQLSGNAEGGRISPGEVFKLSPFIRLNEYRSAICFCQGDLG
jgi:hypothetical protein